MGMVMRLGRLKGLEKELSLARRPKHQRDSLEDEIQQAHAQTSFKDQVD